MLKICKFGGSSLANSKQFAKVKGIIESDEAGTFAINAQFIINAVKDLADQPIELLIDNETRVVQMKYSKKQMQF